MRRVNLQKNVAGNNSFMSSVKWERDSESLHWDGCIVVVMVGRVKLMWKLLKSCPGNPTCTATMASPTCPNCRLGFKDTTSALKHMNHHFTSCHHFPGTGHIFGSGPGFMGWFASNEDAEAWSINPFYPFLLKDKWEIAEFLSCSRLLMKVIDQFLSLNSVSRFNSFTNIWP